LKAWEHIAKEGSVRMPFTVVEIRPETPTRRVIARRLGASYRDAVHVAIRRDVHIGVALSMVDSILGQPDDRFGLLDLIMVSVAEGLREHPSFNSILEDSEHRLIGEMNIGFAVSTPYGLMVPVLKNIGSMPLVEVGRRRRELTANVINRRHNFKDLTEATFTVSNLGPLGVDSVDPIINPPQTAILGVGRIRDSVRLIEEAQVALDKLLTLSLVFDHRVHDGADAAKFLTCVVQRLELTDEPRSA
jgi:pyruvate/2-oxoglutarate dehydrogenase complex dihydrolipoamide acyltransferase (E2) component